MLLIVSKWCPSIVSHNNPLWLGNIHILDKPFQSPIHIPTIHWWNPHCCCSNWIDSHQLVGKFPFKVPWKNSGSSLSGVSVDSGSWGFPAPSSRHWCFSSQKAAAYASGHPLSAGTRHFSRSSYLKKKGFKDDREPIENLQTYWKAKVWAHKKMDKQLIASFQSYWIFEQSLAR